MAFTVNPQNGLAVGIGLASAIFGSAIYPGNFKSIGVILGFGVAGLGILDMLGMVKIGDILPFYKFGGYGSSYYANNTLPSMMYDYPERY